MKIIPAIDLRGGRCVRLYQGDFERQTGYTVEAAVLAKDYAATGLQDLHVVDLDGAQSGKQQNRDIVRELAATSGLAVQLGGGIRRQSQLESWFDSGIARIVIGTLAITEPDRVAAWMSDYGPERIVLALDVNVDDDGEPRVATHGWTRPAETTLWQCIDEFAAAGLQHVLCTDISRDGAMAGPNVSLYEELVARYPGISLQASGGVRDLRDLETLRSAGPSRPSAAARCWMAVSPHRR